MQGSGACDTHVNKLVRRELEQQVNECELTKDDEDRGTCLCQEVGIATKDTHHRARDIRALIATEAPELVDGGLGSESWWVLVV